MRSKDSKIFKSICRRGQISHSTIYNSIITWDWSPFKRETGKLYSTFSHGGGLSACGCCKRLNFIIGHHALEFGPVSLTVVFLTMSNWMPSLKAMMRDLTTKDLHDFLTGIGPSLLFKAYILEECREDGPEDEKNNRLGSVHGARNPYERRYAYLAEIMLLSRTFDAQDHRDRVFAPLSLASRFVPPQQQALDWITPDYSQETTVASVFTAVSTLLIKKLPIMSLLSMVEDRKERRLLELPSWVPDFSCRKSAASLAYTANYEIYDFLDFYLSLDYLDDRGKYRILFQVLCVRTVKVCISNKIFVIVP
jgi:hypothetical protein